MLMPRAARPWFRFYVEAIHDRKLRRLTPAQRWLWVVVLAGARQSPTPGVLLVTLNEPVDDHDLADMAGMTLREIRSTMPAFETAGLLTHTENGAWRVVKWAERQFEGDFVAPAVPTDVRERILLRDNSTCIECGRTDDLTIDHITPTTKGGTNEDDNLQVLCGRCNSRKGNRLRQQRHRESQRNGEVTPSDRDEPNEVTSPEDREQKTDTEAEKTDSSPPATTNGASSKSLALVDDVLFLAFWSAYPKHKSRGAAWKAWQAAIKKADPETIIDAARRYAIERQGEDPTYTPHGSSWLNQERWLDEPTVKQAAEPKGFAGIRSYLERTGQ